MTETFLYAQAKINLTLDVLGKRSDGYHEVAMVMQSVALADRILLREQAGGVSVAASIADLPCGRTNLAYRAALLLMETFSVKRGVHIFLEKRIPVAAGLAGGSTDAAAVLQGLNRLWQLGLSLDELCRLGAALGSDVPFCLAGGTALASGRGEIITALPDLPECPVVLAKLPLAVSTASVYRRFCGEAVTRRPDTLGVVDAVRRGDWDTIAGKLANVLESVTIADHPEIQEIKEIMLQAGAISSLMSGSGPTVFGIAQSDVQADYIADKLKSSTRAEVFVTRTTTRTV